MAIESRIIERDNTQYVVTVEANKLDNYIDTINEEFDFLIDSIRASLVESKVNNIKIKQYIESVNESTILTEEEKAEVTNNKLKNAILSAVKFVKTAADKLWKLIKAGISAALGALNKLKGKTLDNVPVKRKVLDYSKIVSDSLESIDNVCNGRVITLKSINDYMTDTTISNNKLFADCNKGINFLDKFKDKCKTKIEANISLIIGNVENFSRLNDSDLTIVDELSKLLGQLELIKSAITYLVQTAGKLK